MNGYNFTERVRIVLAGARNEAGRLRHEYVGTEHILLSLINEDAGVAARVFSNLGIDLPEIRRVVDATILTGKKEIQAGTDLPYTSRAKKVLELAMATARDLNHNYVGTEHILLGLLREEKGIAAQVLVDAGLTVETARAEVVRILGSSPGEVRRTTPVSSIAFVKMDVTLKDGSTVHGVFNSAAAAIQFLHRH